MILSSNDGMDEISVSDVTINFINKWKIEDIEINPRRLWNSNGIKEDIIGEGPEFNAKLTRDILSKKLLVQNLILF